MCERFIQIGQYRRGCDLKKPTGHAGLCSWTASTLECIYLGKNKIVVKWRD